MKSIPILYVHNSSVIGGGNSVLLTLFDQLRHSKYQPVSLLPDAGPMEKELRRRHIPYRILDLHRALHGGRLTSIRMTLRIAAWMLRRGVRLVHVNDPRYYRWASLAAKWLGVARVCHLHLHAPATEITWAFRTPPHAAIACSAEIARHLKSVLPGLPEDRLVAIANAVDVDIFKPCTDVAVRRDQLGLDRSRLVVTIVGLVSERKGHKYFLEMAQQVARSDRNVQFLVVGEDTEGRGQYRRAMEQYARELGVESRVAFLGFRDDTPALIAASDVVVLPSLWEGLPVSLLEAHACGKPVVATALDGIAQIVEDEVTGLLVPPRDTAALTKAVVRLLDDADLRRRMGIAARARVERLFSAASYATVLRQIYRRLLA